MSATIGRLNVDLTMETARFRRGAQEAQTTADRMRGEMRKVATAIGGAFAIPALGGMANEFREMGKEAIRSAQEIEQLAQLANAGVEEFQRAAYGARSVGIENEKLADIYKDVNDKIGDFIATGGGGMADFFENIAPKVGVTAEQFERLSGPQALQLYVSSLEKAGLSQQQMTFYMEALASDATGLIPLLQDGGKAMGEFAAKADELGLVMSSEEIAKAKEVANNLGLLNAQIDAQTNKKLLENADSILYFEKSLAELKLGLIDTAVTIDQKYRGVQQFFYDFGRAVEQNGRDTRAWAESVPAHLRAMRDNALQAIEAMITGVRTWVIDRLNAVWNSVSAKIEWIANKFKWLDDVVVRHSFIPDMVKSIAEWMTRLETDMVAKSGRAADRTAARFKALRDELSPLMRDLFPEAVALADRDRSLEVIAQGEKDGAITPDQAEEARRRANWKLSGYDPNYKVEIEGIKDGDEPLIDFEKAAKDAQEILKPLAKQTADWGDVLRGISGVFGGTAADIADVIATVINPAIETSINKVGQMQSALAGLTSILKSVFGEKAGGIIGGVLQVGAAFLGARTGGKLPGFAKGGSGIISGYPGVDKNLLSLNGNPIARVGHGELLNVQPAGAAAAAQRGELTVRLAKDGNLEAHMSGIAGRVVRSAAPGMIRASSNAAVGTMARMRDRSLVGY